MKLIASLLVLLPFSAVADVLYQFEATEGDITASARFTDEAFANGQTSGFIVAEGPQQPGGLLALAIGNGLNYQGEQTPFINELSFSFLLGATLGGELTAYSASGTNGYSWNGEVIGFGTDNNTSECYGPVGTCWARGVWRQQLSTQLFDVPVPAGAILLVAPLAALAFRRFK